MIDVKDLRVRADHFVLRDINLSIGDSLYGVILGPSGAGKSLLLETIIGLRSPESGRVFIGGADVTETVPEERQLAYVPQDMTLFPHLSVGDNLCFGARTQRLPEADINRRMEQLTQLLDIGHVLGRRNPLTLSRGEQQRVAIARALMISPRAILLDEPFSALDEQLRRQLQLQLRQINRELKITILHVTHDREEAFMLGDIIGIIIDGTLMQTGGRDDIYYRPATVDVARLLLNQNIFTGRVVDRDSSRNTVVLRGSGLQVNALSVNGLQPGDMVHFGIRPEEIMIIRPGKSLGDPVQDNHMQGTIETIIRKGCSHLVLVRAPGLRWPLEIDIPNCAFRDLDLREGSRVLISLKMKSVWSIPA